MMLFDPALVAEPLIDVVRSATAELRVQAESLPPQLRRAFADASRRAVRIRYLLGPRASYTLDARGRPMLPSRPYAQDAQVDELAFAGATGELMINPRYSEFDGGGDYRPGARSHAFYMATSAQAVICTGAPLSRKKILCLSSQTGTSAALAALFDSEFDDRAADTTRVTLARQARDHVVVGPDDNAPLLQLLQKPGAMVLTSELDEGRALAQLKRGPARMLLLPAMAARTPAAEAARRAGIEVRALDADFDGTVVWTTDRAFVGSQRLTDSALQQDRDVGVLLQAEGAAAVRRYLLDAR